MFNFIALRYVPCNMISSTLVLLLLPECRHPAQEVAGSIPALVERLYCDLVLSESQLLRSNLTSHNA